MGVPRLARVAACTLLFLCGCSSSVAAPEILILPAAQAQDVARFLTNVSSSALRGSMAQGASAAAAGPQKVAINVSVKQTYTCRTAGRIEVSGALTGSISDQTGTGIVQLQVIETITSCREPTTNGGWFELRGSPYLTLAGTFSFLGGAPTRQQSLSLGGGVSWAYDTGQDGYCGIRLTLLLDTQTGSSTVSGTVCDHPVNFTT